MTNPTTNERNFKLPKVVRNILLIVSSLSIVNVLLTSFGASYFSQNTGTFIGKSGIVIFSDFFFLEGTVILAIGIFVEVIRVMREPRPFSKPSTEKTIDKEESIWERIRLGILMGIVGAILIGISVVVGSLR